MITQGGLGNLSQMAYSKMMEGGSKVGEGNGNIRELQQYQRNGERSSPFIDRVAVTKQNIVKFPSLNKNLSK